MGTFGKWVPGTVSLARPMGAPLRSQSHTAASGSPASDMMVPTSSARHGDAGWCQSKTPRGMLKTRSSPCLMARIDAAKGGDREGSAPQQSTNILRSEEMLRAWRRTTETLLMTDQRAGHESARSAGRRQPAEQTRSSSKCRSRDVWRGAGAVRCSRDVLRALGVEDAAPPVSRSSSSRALFLSREETLFPSPLLPAPLPAGGTGPPLLGGGSEP